MSTDPIEALLREADSSAPGHRLVPPTATDLERRRRHQVARRAGLLLLVVLPAIGIAWTAAIESRRAAEGLASPAESLARSLQELDDTLAALRERPPAPSAASESAATATFRTLQRGAARGDEASIQGLRWLADQFPETHGGRCARLFLDTSIR
ncbi:MAG: hypothetical protein AAGB93_00830 [Planctomycetota bacterium]